MNSRPQNILGQGSRSLYTFSDLCRQTLAPNFSDLQAWLLKYIFSYIPGLYLTNMWAVPRALSWPIHFCTKDDRVYKAEVLLICMRTILFHVYPSALLILAQKTRRKINIIHWRSGIHDGICYRNSGTAKNNGKRGISKQWSRKTVLCCPIYFNYCTPFDR